MSNYTITELARLAGVSTRTLRYYDQIRLLRPRETTTAGMRIYGAEEVERLRQVLFYRELDVPLAEIRRLLNEPAFDPVAALEEHRQELVRKRERITQLIEAATAAIHDLKGVGTMKDASKFEALKRREIATNEKKYGAEVRAKHGDAAMDEANARYSGLSQAQYERMQSLSSEIIALLLRAMDQGDVRSATAKDLVVKHKEWLMIFWPKYSPDAHKAMAQIYVDDERFRVFYDRHREGAARFLRDAIIANA